MLALQSITDKAISENSSDLSYEYLFGIKKDEFEKILENPNNIDIKQLTGWITRARNLIGQTLPVLENELSNIESTVKQSEIATQIREYIVNESNTLNQKAKDLISKYTDGIAGLTSGYIESLEESEAKNIPESDTILDEFYKWISENASKAAALFENLDYARFNENEFKEYLNKYPKQDSNLHPKTRF